ncbi:MAG: ABC transporter ATP-binding protein/permease [Rickettsiales bacterium]|nr:ABC transporter ATP-binding protein/permease [Rickettsiales bacterium]
MVAGTTPLLISYSIAWIIDAIVATQQAITITNIFSNIITLVATYAMFLLLKEAFSIIHAFLSDHLGDLIKQKTKFLILQKISLYPTDDLFNTPEITNLMALCKKNVEKADSYVNIVSFFIKGAFSLIPAIAAVFFLEWWIPLLLTITFIPICWSKMYFQKCIWEDRKHFSYLYNIMNLNEECLLLKNYSKEMKLYNMQQYVLNYWNDSFFQIFYSVNKIRKRGVCTIVLLAIINAVGVAICFYYVVSNTITGKFTVGSLSLLFSIVLQLRGSISTFIYGAGEIIGAKLALKPLIELLNIEEPKIAAIISIDDSKSNNLLTIQNGSFNYPGNKNLVIDNISLNIKTGEKIAIVGANGSGKTTLVKLICRLHAFSKGNILWQGQNLNFIEFDKYREQIAALFQDFAKFPLTVRDNIDVRKRCIIDDLICDSLRQGQLSLLQDKLNCYLSTSIKDGIELSGGQWQKLAITRIILDIMKNDKLKLIIFDEPTAALDPHSEQLVMKQIFQIPRNKTSIIISHRLALTRFVDTILVMEKGKIIEQGNHNHLITLKGIYYTMYTNQASYYISGDA